MATPPDAEVQALIATSLGEKIKADFAAAGTTRIYAGDLREGVDLAMWRRVARRIAHELGRPFHSLLDPGTGQGWAQLTDFPATPQERAARDAMLRRVIESVASQ